MPTRQTSSSGRPKSPRIQVVLPEDLCDRLAVLADLEARTVSNMARVLIQQGVERLEQLHGLEPDAPPAEAPQQLPQAVRPIPQAQPRGERSRSATPNANPNAARFDPGTSGGARSGGERSTRGSTRDQRFGTGSAGTAPSRGTPASGGVRRGGSSTGSRISGEGFRDDPLRTDASQADAFETDEFRAELERQGQQPSRRLQKPRRLRIWRPS